MAQTAAAPAEARSDELTDLARRVPRPNRAANNEIASPRRQAADAANALREQRNALADNATNPQRPKRGSAVLMAMKRQVAGLSEARAAGESSADKARAVACGRGEIGEFDAASLANLAARSRIKGREAA